MKITNNRIIVDLSKVQHGSFWYVNQYGQTAYCLPTWSSKSGGSGLANTVRKELVYGERPALFHPDHIGETELARAERLGILDVWTPVCSFQLTANHSLTYTGKKAVSMWAAWRERIFSKK